MKKIFVTMMMALAIVGMAGCQKEKITPAGENPTTEDPTTYNLVRTSWQGVYQDQVRHPQYGQLPCVLTWTMDFMDESNVNILLDLSVGGQSQTPQELACQYTLNGLKGELIYQEGGETSTTPFEIDPINRTFSAELIIATGFSQEDPQEVGGVTIFHQIR